MWADSWSAIAATPKKQLRKNGKYQFKCRNGMMISLSRCNIHGLSAAEQLEADGLIHE
jgi:desulfoferrodoxin (superoxide reductase-like protein)